jgi:hypothetical protein
MMWLYVVLIAKGCFEIHDHGHLNIIGNIKCRQQEKNREKAWVY